MREYDPLDADADPFRPPAISTLVGCIHCGEEYDSYRIEWRVETDSNGRPMGFWCCPMPGCDGRGFGFDIFPVDPEYRDENGERMWVDDDEEAEQSADDEIEPPSSDREGGTDVQNSDDEPLPW